MPESILVVDDDAVNRELLSRYLAKQHYDVQSACDAHEALDRLARRPFDLVIMDVMMPGLSGLDALTMIRQQFSSSELPIIMATAKSSSEDIVDALERGANDYIIKPLDLHVAAARIKKALQEHHQAMLLQQMNRQLLDRQSGRGGDPMSEGDSSGMKSSHRIHDTADMTAGIAAWLDPTSDTDVGDPKTRPIRSNRERSYPEHIGKYYIRKLLGVGSTGKVFLGFDSLMNREVAIKVLSDQFGEDDIPTRRFLNEAKAIARLGHPHIIAFYDINRIDGALYIAMEYAPGGSLRKRVDKVGRLNVADACRYVIQTASGLQAAHDLQFVHRDVKPDNLLLAADDTVRITDFGIVKHLQSGSTDPELTQGVRAGTPMYMSPEQITFSAIDCRTDVYALGGTFYFLLTGQPPFVRNTVEQVTRAHREAPRPNPARHVPGLPEACSRIVARAMAVDPCERYPNMRALAADVESVLNEVEQIAADVTHR